MMTGPLFAGNQVHALKGRVLVPTMIYKAVVDPVRKEGAAYLVNNAAGDEYKIVSLAELERVAGIDLFPTLSPQAKARAMQLPAPSGKRR